MALTLAEIRAKLQAAEDKKNKAGSNSFGDGLTYAHWNINEGDTATLRFAPDADPTNDFFWREKQIIKLPFPGIKGKPESKPCVVHVPCIEMWEDAGTCPILAEVRPWFKDPELEELGKKYWKKRSYIMQGWVRKNPLKEDTVPESPIRRFVMSPQIFNLIKAAVMDPELENLPTDFQNGLDFSILKTSKGGYSDYGTSKWARKESALSQEELDSMEKYGLANLSEALPKRPTKEDLAVMLDMFHASVDGEYYDSERWEKHFKPSGFNADTKSDTTPPAKAEAAAPAKESTPAPAADTPAWEDAESTSVETPAEEIPPSVAAAAGGSRAEDILQMIRNRQKTA